MGRRVVRGEGLGRVFGDGAIRTVALRDAALDVAAGELVVLRGTSGAGKTTLLSLLAGLDAPTTGRAWIGDLEVTAASETELADLRRGTLGIVAQEFALIPMLTAAENIELPLRLSQVAADERAARVAELLELVGLTPHAHQRPDELSGGQQQRVAIARALVHRPTVVLADEPTAQLDSATAEEMMRLLADRVHSDGVAALVSTHDPALVAIADRVIELHDGRVRPAG
ncbi:ABC transporter ATP-binding protein [Microbacterium terricola]|uniref:ABC transporter ATP-binding protein n=1 Tax=Microbacterium terricola TaxID=344163 RepID=A0ABM8DWF8_9MICO|nr:ABC transporter ATP-binding protein [Microbacterium terricola]UYK39313.1 ABC transporter ATP-binding protein [Microbacterium terricola]BDV29964.1 ABC transporter ATP-binding protein [Microbacterium terricola]